MYVQSGSRREGADYTHFLVALLSLVLPRALFRSFPTIFLRPLRPLRLSLSLSLLVFQLACDFLSVSSTRAAFFV